MSVTIKGGRKISDYINKMRREFEEAPTVLVGVPKAAGNYEDGVHTATIASVQEYGSADGRIPERSFLRAGISDAEGQIKKVYEKFLPEAIDGKTDMNHIQSLVGEVAAGRIVERISEGIDPANAASTVKAKGSSTPLIDTGHLRNSITYELSAKGEDVEEGL